MSPLRVSLVATVLDEAASLPAWLRSIEAQTRQPDEVVIVDGGSTDGTWEALQSWGAETPGASVRRWAGANIAQGRNAAIKHANGELIAVTDAGTTLDARWLERIIATIEAGPLVDVASGFFLPDFRGRFERAIAATVLPALDDVDPERFLPSSRSVAFRRSAWAGVGGYPEWLDYSEDLVFDLALRRAGYRFAFAPDAVVKFRPRPGLAAFFTQYYRYARGDGKADLWRWRHAARYAAYSLGPALLWRGRRSPVAIGLAAAAAALYLRRPIERLVGLRIADCGLRNEGARHDAGFPRSQSAFVGALALVPIIRVVGDVAKMLGYPAGVLWRLRRLARGEIPPTPTLPLKGGGGSAQPTLLPYPESAVRNPQSTVLSNQQSAISNQQSTCDLSVVIVSYNTRNLLQACLGSLERSIGVASRETFVVDNASTDGSAEMVAAEFPWVQLIRSSVNGGYAYANNMALRQAGGKRVLLLNPDTELGPTAIADMVAYLDAHPNAGAVGPKLIRPDGTLDLACRRSFPSPAVAFYRLVGLSSLFPGSPVFGRYNLTYLHPDVETEVDSVTGAFMLVRREAIEQVGLLDERFFMYGEDLDWAFRMKERGWHIRYNPKVTVVHHKGASSRQTSERTTVHFYRAMQLFYEKHYRDRAPSPLGWLVVAGIYLRLGWSLLKNALRPDEEHRVAT